MGAPTLRARLVGGLEPRLGDRAVPPLDSGRAEGLLAYLLLHRDAPQPRQRLAFLIWPDSSEAQAWTGRLEEAAGLYTGDLLEGSS